jgi:hypothetical protein
MDENLVVVCLVVIFEVSAAREVYACLQILTVYVDVVDVLYRGTGEVWIVSTWLWVYRGLVWMDDGLGVLWAKLVLASWCGEFRSVISRTILAFAAMHLGDDGTGLVDHHTFTGLAPPLPSSCPPLSMLYGYNHYSRIACLYGLRALGWHSP